jgi:alpha-tubulin suppressor-like RCC1 family protein
MGRVSGFEGSRLPGGWLRVGVLAGVVAVFGLAGQVPTLAAASAQLSGSVPAASKVAASATEAAEVPFVVFVRASGSVVAPGGKAVLSGRVSPAVKGVVVLQERVSGRWRGVGRRVLSKRSSFVFRVRPVGVGGHMYRVVKATGHGHALGTSDLVALVVSGRRVVRSRGGAVRVRLGAVVVSAPAGAIRSGQTLSIAVGMPTGFGGEGAISVAGGPYVVSTSQGEPSKPVAVSISYDPGLLGKGESPLVLHGWKSLHKWVPEITTVDAARHVVTATLGTFSPLDVVGDVSWGAGVLTGNRSDLPGNCARSAPSWIEESSLLDGRNDSLPACFSNASNGSVAVINVVNNRGYAQTLTISGARIDVQRSSWSDSLEGEVATVWAALSHTNSQMFMVAPGGSASLYITKPPSQLASQTVYIDSVPRTGFALGEMGFAFLTTISDTIGKPVDVVDCVLSDLYNGISSGAAQASAIDQLHSCANAASGLSGVAKTALTKIAAGLLVDTFFYNVIDLEVDELYPPQLSFTIPGTNPSYTLPSIHLGPANFGTLPDGQQTIEHLTATGGTPPYTYHFYNRYPVPAWVTLAPDGTLTISPPTGDNGSYSFYVYVTDSTNQHSPFARDQTTFTTAPVGPSGPGGGTTPPSGPATAIAPGFFQSCALLPNGRIACWGDDQSGELGNGMMTSSLTPVAVSGITNATAITAGQEHTCALLAGGGIVCWGYNGDGELGNGTSTGPSTCTDPENGDSDVCSTTPVPVSGITNATAISAGGYDTCALLSGGTVDCWGNNHWGELGDGTTVSRSTPVPVSGITHAVAITTSEFHSCALLATNAVECWGYNGDGALGDGTTTSTTTPVGVTGITSAIAINGNAYDNVCALLAGGGVDCWGNNEGGQLGDGTTNDSTTPVAVSGITNATAVTTGPYDACALLSGGAIDCWGANAYGELGNGTYSGQTTCTDPVTGAFACSPLPAPVSGIADATAISAGTYDACALLSGGQIDCWGYGYYGELGDGSSGTTAVPVVVTGLP